MNTIIKRVSILFYSVTVLISCSENIDDGLSANEIVGTWFKTDSIENSSYDQSLEYTFNVDNTMVVYRIVLDNNTSETIGYRYKANGTYRLNGTELNMQLFEIYGHDDTMGLFSSIENLKLTGETRTESPSITFSQDKNDLTLNYLPCSTSENCINSQTFQKKK